MPAGSNAKRGRSGGPKQLIFGQYLKKRGMQKQKTSSCRYCMFQTVHRLHWILGMAILFDVCLHRICLIYYKLDLSTRKLNPKPSYLSSQTRPQWVAVNSWWLTRNKEWSCALVVNGWCNPGVIACHSVVWRHDVILHPGGSPSPYLTIFAPKNYSKWH